MEIRRYPETVPLVNGWLAAFVTATRPELERLLGMRFVRGGEDEDHSACVAVEFESFVYRIWTIWDLDAWQTSSWYHPDWASGWIHAEHGPGALDRVVRFLDHLGLRVGARLREPWSNEFSGRSIEEEIALCRANRSDDRLGGGMDLVRLLYRAGQFEESHLLHAVGLFRGGRVAGHHLASLFLARGDDSTAIGIYRELADRGDTEARLIADGLSDPGPASSATTSVR